MNRFTLVLDNSDKFSTMRPSDAVRDSKSPDLIGGAERDRTVDLLNAIQALSQLSYSPTWQEVQANRNTLRQSTQRLRLIPGQLRIIVGRATK